MSRDRTSQLTTRQRQAVLLFGFAICILWIAAILIIAGARDRAATPATSPDTDEHAAAAECPDFYPPAEIHDAEGDATEGNPNVND